MGFVYLAIIRCVFHINAAKKKKSRFINFDFPKKKIVTVASLNQPVAGRGFLPHWKWFRHRHIPINAQAAPSQMLS
jgi:hypothetical protein